MAQVSLLWGWLSAMPVSLDHRIWKEGIVDIAAIYSNNLRKIKMLKVLSRVFLGLSLGVIPVAQAGLFDAITGGVGNMGAQLVKGAMDSGSKDSGSSDSAAQPAGVTIKLENMDAMPKAKKVILSNFVVEFQSRYSKTKSGFSFMGLGNAGSSTSINDVTLPSYDTLQTITNFAYLDVVKKLKAKGYEVIQVSDLSPAAKASHEEMAKGASAIKSGEEFTNIDGESVLYSPDGMTSVLPAYGCNHYPAKGFTDIMSNGARQITPKREQELANAQGRIPLLKVWITVGFGEVDAKGGHASENYLKRQQGYGSVKTNIESGNQANASAGMFLKQGATHFALTIPTLVPADENRIDYKGPRCPNTDDQNSNALIKLNTAADKAFPADGDALILLEHKYRDDGSEVVALSNKANSIGIADTAIGSGIGIRSTKENSDGTQAQSSQNGQGVKLSLKGSSSSGRIVGNDASNGTRINTTSQYATEIGADFYATSAVKMIDEVSTAFIGKL